MNKKYAIFIIAMAVIVVLAAVLYPYFNAVAPKNNISTTATALHTNYSKHNASNASLTQYPDANCPAAPTNASKSQLLLLVKDTSQENLIGACALAALASYNSSGTLARYNISINLTELNMRFEAGHPQYNSTVITFSTSPSMLCIRASTANSTNKMKCNIYAAGNSSDSQILNVTLSANAMAGLEKLFIPNVSKDTAIITFKNGTNETINVTNTTEIKAIFGSYTFP